jgi:two-component system, OmpR family, sensor kinase
MRSFFSHLSIRWRLAVLSAGLTFLVLCGFAVVIGQLTASRIRSDFNHEVAAAVDDLRDQLELDYSSNNVVVRTDIPTFAAPNHAVIRVLHATSGRIIAQTKGAPNFGLAGVAVKRTDQVGGYRVETRRAVLRPVNTPPGANFQPVPVFVQYARKVSDVEATVHRVRVFLLLGVLAGSGLALLLALMLSRRALAPIARLTAAARDIGRTRDPSRRVPVPDTDDEVAELARTLDDMLQSLESSRAETAAMLSRQRQFVADASHELRTPLTSVLANLELLADVLDGERGEAARSALRSSQRMRRLVGDLLLLARADAKRQLPREPTDVGRVLVEAAAELEPVADGHELTVDADEAVVQGTRDELHRLALNLMENAIRHTPGGTHVNARVAASNGEVLLTVEDDGPGVPAELRERIFERFVRGVGDRGSSSGLGLSIVRAVAESHGGSVTFEDAHPGARFVVRLPRAEMHEPEAEPAQAL